MRNTVLFIGIALIVAFTAGFAKEASADEDKVKLSAQIRTRAETDARDFSNDTDPMGFTLLRLRLNAEFQATNDISGFVQLQDSRTFGAEPNTLADTANVDLHQGYIEVEDFLIDDLELKMGRMELAYANERLIGAVGWHNVGRAFDGGLLSYEASDNLTIDFIGMTLVDQADPADVGDTGSDFGGVYAMYHPNNTYHLDIYVLGEWNRKESVRSEDDLQRLTAGIYDKGKLGALDYEVEIAGQTGKRFNPDSRARQDIAAFMLTGAIGYTGKGDTKPRIAVGYDYLSGQERGDEDYKAFDTLFATNHKFYGYMDYFVNVPANTGGAGLQDLMARLRIDPHKKVTLAADFHHLMSAKKVRDENTFGQEVDLTATWRYAQALTFILGASVFVPDTLMEARFGGNDDAAFWSYLMTTASF